MDMSQPTPQDVRRALEAGSSGEAVLAASRLVEQLSTQIGSNARRDLAEAMTLLALAFEADGDPGGAEKIARALLGQSAGAGPTHLRARALIGRYLRQQGDYVASEAELRTAVASGSVAGSTGAQTELGGVRAELVLTLVEMGGSRLARGSCG